MKKKQNTNASWRKPAPTTALPRLLISASVMLALVAGCSNSDDDGESPDDSVELLVGAFILEIEDVNGAPETQLNAAFFRFDDTTISSDVINAQITLRDDDDFCIVNGQGDDDLIDPDFDDFLEQTISAGQILTLTSPMGTFATLERNSLTIPSGTVIAYLLPGESVSGMPPAGLTLDIPGDVFPMFSNVTIPEVPAPLTDFSPPTDDSVDVTTTFSWTPSGVADARVSLSLDSDAESINCLLVDDGSFTLPDSVTAQLMGMSDLTVGDADRDATVFVRSGDAVLFVVAEDTRVE